MGTQEDMREVKLNYLRDRKWSSELKPQEIDNLIQDLYEQHDYLLEKVKRLETMRFTGKDY